MLIIVVILYNYICCTAETVSIRLITASEFIIPHSSSINVPATAPVHVLLLRYFLTMSCCILLHQLTFTGKHWAIIREWSGYHLLVICISKQNPSRALTLFSRVLFFMFFCQQSALVDPPTAFWVSATTSACMKGKSGGSGAKVVYLLIFVMSFSETHWSCFIQPNCTFLSLILSRLFKITEPFWFKF